MPYSMSEIPDRIKDLPKEAQEIWIAAYNSAYKQYDKDEEKANATAWASVKKKYEKNDKDEWVKIKNSSKEFKFMQYDYDNPPLKIQQMPKEAQKTWIDTFNASILRQSKDDNTVNAEIAEREAESEVYKQGWYEDYVTKKWAKHNQKGEVEYIASTEKSEQIFTDTISFKDSSELLGTSEDLLLSELKTNKRIPVISTRTGIGATPTVAYRGKKLYPYLSTDFINSVANRFSNVKTFLGHITKTEQENGERDVKRWVATLSDPTVVNLNSGEIGIKNWLNIHDDWLLTRMENKNFREGIGLSHDMSTQAMPGKLNNKDIMTAVSLLKLHSVDLVTDPNYQCGVFKQSKSIERRGDDIMELETITLTDLKAKRPDLVDEIAVEFKNSAPNLTREVLEKDYPNLVKEIVEIKTKATTDQITELTNEVRSTKIDLALTKTDLPDKAKERIKQTMVMSDGKNFDADLTKHIEAEKTYIAEIKGTGKARPQGGGTPADQDDYSDVRSALDNKLGIKTDNKQ